MWRWLYVFLGFSTATLKAAEHVEFEGGLYHLHRIDQTSLSKLQLIWLGENGKPLGNFSALRQHLAASNQKIVFATNAGIYEKGPKPCGLTVCGSVEQVPLNLRADEGNFYLKPNGVFFVDDKRGAGIMESAEFARSGIKPRLATQSGPLMMRKGVFHPAFQENSPNKRLRNAVGVTAKGEVIFAMSDREDRIKGRVTFHQFSRFFKSLGCDDVLFLDGDLSDMLVKPDSNVPLIPNTFAAMFFVSEAISAP